jgi:hypothetical protein
VNERELGRLIVAVVPPDEAGAERRAWPVVCRAFAEREPASPRSGLRHGRALALAGVAAAAIAAFASPPGRAVLDSLRDAIGKERITTAKPALFALPAAGRLLVVSTSGAWVVHGDGSRRFLGRYREASWSPHGLFVVAVRGHELRALTPTGQARWTLSRRGHLAAPRWGGTFRDTRIAYLRGDTLRVVAGDGTGDRLLARRVAPVAPAWRPYRPAHQLAFADAHGRIRLVDADSRRTLAVSRPGEPPRQLLWTPSGRRLLVVTRRRLRLLDARGHVRETVPTPVGARNVAAAFSPLRRDIALLRRLRGGLTELVVVKRHTSRRLFSGLGRFDYVAWSPRGGWLLAGWESANQWLFVQPSGRRQDAVSNISTQFQGERFPVVPMQGWCCP